MWQRALDWLAAVLAHWLGYAETPQARETWQQRTAAYRERQKRLATQADLPVGDDLCDLCRVSGVNVYRTTYCGQTIGVECGCEDYYQSGTCGCETCEECFPPKGCDDGKKGVSNDRK